VHTSVSDIHTCLDVVIPFQMDSVHTKPAKKVVKKPVVIPFQMDSVHTLQR